MKKILMLLVAVIMLSTICSCGSNKDTEIEELLGDYITAVRTNDHEAIWNMLPLQIQDYAIENGIVENKEGALDYIAFALTDYYMFEELALPSRDKVSFNITKIFKEDISEAQAHLDENGVLMTVEDACFVEFVITADNEEDDADFYLIKSNDKWYLTSVIGDDELFKY